MKRIYILFLIFVLSILTANAQTVSESTAHSRAEAFFATQAANAPGRGNSAPSASLTLAYTSQGNGNTRFYVYNRGENEGYVIMGGDEQAKEILAYVPQGHFVYDSLPDNMKWWLGQYEQEIDTAIIRSSHAPKRTIQKSPNRSSVANARQDIPDMITTKWNQGAPFNSMIPTTPSGLQFPSGCVPTALAQIMKYWNYPQVGSGSNSYVMSGDEGDITFSADFGNTTYDWVNMIDDYSGQYTEQQALAVGQLMYHIGVALEVMYNFDGTGYGDWQSGDFEHDHHMVKILKDNFHYNSKMRRVNRNMWKDEDWKDLIYSELLAGRPVYYSATKNVGHAFICHGYSNSLDMFSINWGWGGYMDGYFSLSGTDALDGYNILHSIIVGMCPDSIVLSTPLVGDTIQVDNLNYIVRNTIDKKVGCSQTYLSSEISELHMPTQVTYFGETYDVTYIERYAFNNAFLLHSLFLPSTIETLAESAFYNSGIDSITVPDKVKKLSIDCFADCKNLQKVEMDSVEEIGAFCFERCYSLREVIIPDKVTYLHSYTFENCRSLTTVTLPSGFLKIANGVFEGCPLMKMYCYCDVPDCIEGIDPFEGVRTIEEGVLYVPSQYIDNYRSSTYWSRWGRILPIEDAQTDHVGEIITRDGLTFLLGYESATLIKSGVVNSDTLRIPAEIIVGTDTFALRTIAAEAFSGNGFSGHVEIPEGVVSIEQWAFVNCDATSITLPKSLRRIGDVAIANMGNLRSLRIPGDIEYMGQAAFAGNANVEELIIEEGITKLSERCFGGYKALKSVILPHSLTHIDYGTFRECNSLKEMYILSPQILSRYFDLHEIFFTVGEPEDFDENQSDGTLYLPANLTESQREHYTNDLPWSLWGNVHTITNPIGILLAEDTIHTSKNIIGRIYPELIPSNASVKEFIYSSTDESVVKVNELGEYVAIGNGEADIVVSSYVQNNISTRSHIIVEGARPIMPDSIECILYEPFKFDYTSYQFNFRHNWVLATGLNGGEWWNRPELYNAEHNLISDTLSFSGGDLYLSILTDHPIGITIGGESRTIYRSREINDVNFDASQRIVYLFKDVPANPVVKIKTYVSGAVLKELKVWSEQYASDSRQIQYYDYDESLYFSDPAIDSISTSPIPSRPSDFDCSFYTFRGWKLLDGVEESYIAEYDYNYEYAHYNFSASSENTSWGYTMILQAPNCKSDTAIIEANGYYGYIFDHWSDDNTDNPRTIVLDSDTSLLAYFIPGCNIHFYDGSSWQTIGVNVGEMPVYSGPTPTQEGGDCYYYEFTGWWPELSPAIENASYYAQFDLRYYKYNVVFQDYDGTILQQDSVECGNWGYYNGVTPTRPATAQYSFWFTGWSPNPNDMWVNEDKVYMAQYDSIVRPYLITFTNELGNILQQSWVEYGQLPTYNNGEPYKPADAQYTYSFAGWSPSVDVVTGEATYTATFSHTTNSYMVSFVNYDGSTLQSGSINYGVTPTYTGATPTRPATAQYTYTFKGWDKEIVSVVGVETYTAQFDSVVNKYTITFLNEDGTVLQTSEVEYGQVPAYNGAIPTKAATAQYTYTFSDWTPEVVAVTGAATYTATYTSMTNSYLITFANYDGTTLQSGNVNYGVTPAYTGATPIKPATAQYTYTFKGWDKEIVSVVEVETYTAQFDSVVNQYTITVIGENCTITGDGTYDYGTEVTLTVTPDEGYLFVEWSDGLADAIRQIVVTEDATYIARTEMQSIENGWQENSLPGQVQKIFDGTNYYILRGGKRYTLQGAEVK